MSLPHPFSGIDRTNRVWFVISAVMVLVIAGLIISVVAVSKANDSNTTATTANHAASQANVSIASQCEFYYGAALASGPTLTTTLTKVGLSILVGARQAYEGLGCDIGPIPDPAPQVKAALPAGVH